ncbi:MAG: hypothetical protein R3C49_06400 [Planctomycetaceae bacterium]
MPVNDASVLGQACPEISSRSFHLSKDGVFGVYVLVFFGPLFLVVMGAIAFFAHDVAFPTYLTFLRSSMARGLLEMWQRPTLILAFLFVLSVVWCLSEAVVQQQQQSQFSSRQGGCRTQSSESAVAGACGTPTSERQLKMKFFLRRKNDDFDSSDESIPAGSIRLGPVFIPPDLVTNHFFAFGATGAGKTLSILRLMLQDIMPEISRHNDWRLLMTNPKRDAISILHGIAPAGVRIETADPFDSRGWHGTSVAMSVNSARLCS